jgi:hypothetical protein
MEVSKIVAELDREIARLKEARALLAGASSSQRVAKKQGAAAPKRKSRMSPEGRKRIAEAMKKRWAERRKQAAKK